MCKHLENGWDSMNKFACKHENKVIPKCAANLVQFLLRSFCVCWGAKPLIWNKKQMGYWERPIIGENKQEKSQSQLELMSK